MHGKIGILAAVSALASVATADVRFGGSLVELTFGDDGTLASIREKAGGRELVGTALPFMSVRLTDGTDRPATSVRQSGDRLVFGFAPLAGACTVRVTPFDGGWTFETLSFDVRDVLSLTLAHVKPGCRRWYGDLACMVSDERSGVVLRAYEPILRTACDEHDVTQPHSLYDAPDKARFPLPEEVENGLVVIADATGGFVGKRFGLTAGPREKLRDALKEMTLVAGVPHSRAGGAWSQEAPENRGSYLFSTLMDTGSAEDWIDLAERGGFTTLHTYAWWRKYGLYDFNTDLFPNGLEDLKKVVKKFHDAGLRVDFHHLSHCIQYVEPIFMPVFTADPDEVIARCSYTLARPFAPGDTEMYVNEKPWDGHTKIMASHANGNALRIGRELVQYHDLSWEKPYRFTKIVRGKFTTQYEGVKDITVSTETFPVGTRVDFLQQRYGSFYPKPGSKLMERVSNRIAEIFNACRGDGVYFDGAEGMMTRYGTEVGRETTFRKFSNANDSIICESACLYPYSWWYRSRIGPWDAAEWGAKRFIDEHIRCLDEYANKANFLRVNLGWWQPMMSCAMARGHYTDEMEYCGAKGAGVDAADGFQLPGIDVSVNVKPVYFNTEDQLTVFGWWERARMARAFSDATLAKLRVPGDEYRLRQDAAGLWKVSPQTVDEHRVADANGAKWTVRAPARRRAELRVAALFGANGYTDADSYSILAPSDAKDLAVTAAKGVTATVAETKDAAKGATLAIEAANANGFRDGAWARVAKHYPLPYCGVTNAVGLWVKGDASGALLNVQLEQAIARYHGYSEHYIRLDFSGWRYFALHLRERDAYDYPHHRWPYSHNRLNTATEVYRTEIFGQTVEYVNLWLNDVPANGRTRVEVTDVRAIGRHPIVITGASVALNGKKVPVPFALKSEEYAELADGVWTKFSAKGVPMERFGGFGGLGGLEGLEVNRLEWSGKAGNEYPRAEVTLLTIGDGEPAFLPERLQATQMKYEAERPEIYAPTKGLKGPVCVKVRPGETARLELRLLGPVDRPTVKVGDVAMTFPVKLGEDDYLRCSDGKTWKVVRVMPLRRPELASGVLPVPLGPLTGVVPVSVSSADDATAAARVNLVKRYR